MMTTPIRLRRRYFVLALMILDLSLVGAVASWFSGRPPDGNADGQHVTARQLASNSQNRIYVPVALLPAYGERPTAHLTVTSGGLAPRPTGGSQGVTTPGLRAGAATQAAATAPSPEGDRAPLQARIEIVWPHDGAALRDADLANVTVYLISGAGSEPLPCAAEPVVRLWQALNMEAARPIGVGQKRMLTSAGHTFPVWDFNDVDIRAARSAGNRLTFFATVEGVPVRHNVWVHGVDARAVYPQAEVPTSVTSQLPQVFNARIEILWPHDALPLEQAQFANITAYLFDAATGRALAPDVAQGLTVRLHQALNNQPDGGPGASRTGSVRTVTGPNGQRFAAWDFNDVDISAARDSLNKQHFWLSVDDKPAFTNIWTHGAAAPTIYPQALSLASCR